MYGSNGPIIEQWTRLNVYGNAWNWILEEGPNRPLWSRWYSSKCWHQIMHHWNSSWLSFLIGISIGGLETCCGDLGCFGSGGDFFDVIHRYCRSITWSTNQSNYGSLYFILLISVYFVSFTLPKSDFLWKFRIFMWPVGMINFYVFIFTYIRIHVFTYSRIYFMWLRSYGFTYFYVFILCGQLAWSIFTYF